MTDLKRALALIFIPALLLFSSCASNKKVVEVQEPAQEQVQQITLQDADEGLRKIVDEAIKEGPAAVQYLASDFYLKASDAALRGDSRTAVLLFKYVLALKPDEEYIKRKYAVELIRTGDFKTAKEILADVYKKSGRKDESIGLILGGVYTALSDIKSARKVYKQVLKQNSKSEEACIFLAKSYSEAKEYKQAFNVLDQCEKSNKELAVFTYFRGKIYLERQKKKKAETFFKKALKIDSSYYQAALGLGLIKEEEEKYEEASKIYLEFLDKNPSNYTILNRTVQILFVLGHFKKVIPFAERLANLDPGDLNLKVRLGILYTDAKRYDEAKGVFKELLEAVPESDKILYYLGSLYQQTEEFDQALGYFSKIKNESALFHDSNVQMGQMLNVMAQENRELHEKKFLEFTKVMPSKDEALKLEFGVMRASYYETLNQYSEAIKELVEVQSDEKFGEDHQYYLASLYEKNKEPYKARGIVEVILVKNPENAHALNFLGYSLLETGDDMKLAYKYIKKAVKLKPKDGFIRDSMGWYYYKTGQYEKALIEIKKAWKYVKTDAVVAKHLAIIYQALKQYDKANKYFVEALKNCRHESEKEEVMHHIEKLKQLRLPASK